MTQLTPTLYEVEVPIDYDSKISILNWFCIRHKKERIWQVEFKLEGNFKILGEVTKDESNVLGFTHEEIISLLQSKGLYFVNPIKEPESRGVSPHYILGPTDEESLAYDEWQESEEKVIKGKRIILEKL